MSYFPIFICSLFWLALKSKVWHAFASMKIQFVQILLAWRYFCLILGGWAVCVYVICMPEFCSWGELTRLHTCLGFVIGSKYEECLCKHAFVLLHSSGNCSRVCVLMVDGFFFCWIFIMDVYYLSPWMLILCKQIINTIFIVLDVVVIIYSFFNNIILK